MQPIIIIKVFILKIIKNKLLLLLLPSYFFPLFFFITFSSHRSSEATTQPATQAVTHHHISTHTRPLILSPIFNKRNTDPRLYFRATFIFSPQSDQTFRASQNACIPPSPESHPPLRCIPPRRACQAQGSARGRAA